MRRRQRLRRPDFASLTAGAASRSVRAAATLDARRVRVRASRGAERGVAGRRRTRIDGRVHGRGARPRERPAMVACPWRTVSQGDTLGVDPARAAAADRRHRSAARAHSGLRAARMACAVGAQSFVPPALPADRPKAIVDDYLKYVVTSPPPEIVRAVQSRHALLQEVRGRERLSDSRLRQGLRRGRRDRARSGQLHARATVPTSATR